MKILHRRMTFQLLSAVKMSLQPTGIRKLDETILEWRGLVTRQEGCIVETIGHDGMRVCGHESQFTPATLCG